MNNINNEKRKNNQAKHAFGSTWYFFKKGVC